MLHGGFVACNPSSKVFCVTGYLAMQDAFANTDAIAQAPECILIVCWQTNILTITLGNGRKPNGVACVLQTLPMQPAWTCLDEKRYALQTCWIVSLHHQQCIIVCSSATCEWSSMAEVQHGGQTNRMFTKHVKVWAASCTSTERVSACSTAINMHKISTTFAQK